MTTRFDLTLKHRWLGHLISVPLDVEMGEIIGDEIRKTSSTRQQADSKVRDELIECIRSGLLFGTENWRIHHLRILEIGIDKCSPEGGGQ